YGDLDKGLTMKDQMQAKDAILETLEMKPTRDLEKTRAKNNNLVEASHPWNLPKSCPQGSIPVRRIKGDEQSGGSPSSTGYSLWDGGLPYRKDSPNRRHVKDGSKTVCYNLKCPGFVHTSGSTSVDTHLQPVSEYGGRQYEITLEIAKDPRTSNWWVYLQGYSLGYWPKELVPAIAGGADVLAFGGEVTNVISSGLYNITQMGSGHPASEGFRKASLLNRIRTSEDPDVYNPPEHNNLDVIIDCNCYNLQVGSRIDRLWGFFLFFGGPGANSKCTC
ncbi:hypothetical protein Taro_056134, partial [Colocasia esculenta]|nr:hypothetical protein [Colocasia esculenta]